MRWAVVGALGTGLVIGWAAAGFGQGAEFPGCSEGTEEVRLDAVGTDLRWCERPGPGERGIRHGPSLKTRNGKLLEAGPYRDGVRHGRWILSATEGLVQEGEYTDDRRSGIWIIRREDGEEVRRDDYGVPGSKAAPEAEAPPSEAEPTTRALRVGNRRSDDLELVLEPGGPVLLLAPGEDATVRLDASKGGDLVIESDDDSLTLRAPRGGALRLDGTATDAAAP